MNLTERNDIIVKKVEQLIEDKGYRGKIFLDPIPNTAKRRPMYYKSKENENLYFTIFMWDVNKLNDLDLEKELNNRIDNAINYFRNTKQL